MMYIKLILTKVLTISIKHKLCVKLTALKFDSTIMCCNLRGYLAKIYIYKMWCLHINIYHIWFLVLQQLKLGKPRFNQLINHE